MKTEKTINSDYSEFIKDRFIGKTPKQFFEFAKAKLLKSLNGKTVNKYSPDVFDTENEYRYFEVSQALSHIMFYDIFNLEQYWNESLLAPGCFMFEEYSDYDELIDKIINDCSLIIYKTTALPE